MDRCTGAKPKLQEKRKVSVPAASAEHKSSLEAFKLKHKRKISLPDAKFNFDTVFDPAAKAHDSFVKRRGSTGVAYDDKMFGHSCLWDPGYPENSERLKSVIKRCNEMGLLDRCHRIPSREATKEELRLVHSENMINKLESLVHIDSDKLREASSKYDSIYLNSETYSCARTAVGCSLEAVKAVVDGTVHNAMSLIRPPGHHAMENDYCGYCFFNNVAVAAKYAIEELCVKRVMIVDWDVHHGQGTQQAFYSDNRVLYFSIHRYENGNFWPNLREGDFDYIGEGKGKGFNINIPLNQLGMRNEDYLHILHNVLLPVAYEFKAELILISAGYDAALGCSEGLMKLTPGFFAHMTHSLMSLAKGKVVAILEGGYFIESLAESAALTLRTLLGDPCPQLVDTLESPTLSIKETILNVMAAHRDHWKCFQFTNAENMTGLCALDPHPSLQYPLKNEDSKFDTMSCYPVTSKEESEVFLKELERLRIATSLAVPKNRVCLAYDIVMEKHRNESDFGFPERPSRTREIMKKFKEADLMKRIRRVETRQATPREMQQVHTLEWVTTLQKIKDLSPKRMAYLEYKYNSVYFNEFSNEAALYAAGCLLQVIDKVCGGESRSGIGVIRPPGHHAEPHEPHGFCLINNVAVGASHAIKNFGLKRILILDWDIHHGNGIQNIFQANPKVLYVSIHAYLSGHFFPNSRNADSCFVGNKSGRGYNVNIPWSKLGMNDGDYLAAFFRVILPICYEFNPELVLVSAGFDAAVNDPLGNCNITPECFAHMTHFLMSLASGKIVLALEGGYNLISTSYSMTMCAKALLGDPLPSLSKTTAGFSALRTINEVIDVQNQFWKLLYEQNKVLDEVKSLRLTPDPQTPDSSEFSTPLDVTPFSTPRKEGKPVLDLLSCFKKLSVTDDLTKASQKCEEFRESDEAEMILSTEEIIEGAVGGTNDPPSLLLIQQMMEAQGMLAVIPLSWCPHLGAVSPVPKEGLNAFAACESCSDHTENWVCLECYQVHCSRFSNGDMLRHRAASQHTMVLSFSDLSVWCYECDSYVNNDILTDALAAATASKFDI